VAADQAHGLLDLRSAGRGQLVQSGFDLGDQAPDPGDLVL